MKTVAIVPARAGSKGFPHKNIARLAGKPLIELAVRVGLGCQEIDEVYISTDSREYEELALAAGAKSLGLRPAELASDTAKTVDVVVDFLSTSSIPWETIVLLQPTSPMRCPQDISHMLLELENKDAQAIVSVEKFEEPHPFKLKQVTGQGYLAPFLSNTTSEVPRQSLPEVYKLNGAIYIARAKAVSDTRSLLPPKTLPYPMTGSINIDCPRDLDIIQGLVQLEKITIYGA